MTPQNAEKVLAVGDTVAVELAVTANTPLTRVVTVAAEDGLREVELAVTATALTHRLVLSPPTGTAKVSGLLSLFDAVDIRTFAASIATRSADGKRASSQWYGRDGSCGDLGSESVLRATRTYIARFLRSEPPNGILIEVANTSSIFKWPSPERKSPSPDKGLNCARQNDEWARSLVGRWVLDADKVSAGSPPALETLAPWPTSAGPVDAADVVGWRSATEAVVQRSDGFYRLTRAGPP